MLMPEFDVLADLTKCVSEQRAAEKGFRVMKSRRIIRSPRRLGSTRDFAERQLWNIGKVHSALVFAALMIGVQRAISLFTSAASGC
jgi:hypothetical protein